MAFYKCILKKDVKYGEEPGSIGLENSEEQHETKTTATKDAGSDGRRRIDRTLHVNSGYTATEPEMMTARGTGRFTS